MNGKGGERGERKQERKMNEKENVLHQISIDCTDSSLDTTDQKTLKTDKAEKWTLHRTGKKRKDRICIELKHTCDLFRPSQYYYRFATLLITTARSLSSLLRWWWWSALLMAYKSAKALSFCDTLRHSVRGNLRKKKEREREANWYCHCY